MYNAKVIVGDFFEKKAICLFDLKKEEYSKRKGLPDLVSKDNSFRVEVKASGSYNGGVINEKQLNKFNANTNCDYFYLFGFHSINKNMKKNHRDKNKLITALDENMSSFYLFPSNIVNAHFNTTILRKTPHHDCFVQICESFAKKIFYFDNQTWDIFNIEKNNYKTTKPHEKIHILTKKTFLEEKIINSISPGSLK
jgi:hypothetical protein